MDGSISVSKWTASKGAEVGGPGGIGVVLGCGEVWEDEHKPNLSDTGMKVSVTKDIFKVKKGEVILKLYTWIFVL